MSTPEPDSSSVVSLLVGPERDSPRGQERELVTLSVQHPSTGFELPAGHVSGCGEAPFDGPGHVGLRARGRRSLVGRRQAPMAAFCAEGVTVATARSTVAAPTDDPVVLPPATAVLQA